MVQGLGNFLTNPTLLSVAQNTKASVGIETGLKAAGRPTFIMLDKNIDKETKKFAAIKEFLYQGTCLAIYFAAIMPIFKNGAVGIAQKLLKNNPDLKLFKNTKEYTNYRKLADTPLAKRAKEDIAKFSNDLQKELGKETANKYSVVKGAIEASSIAGSIIGLTLVAPNISHMVMKPIMGAIENHAQNKKSQEVTKA
ncbi:MAG: hypothetical protein MJ229_01065 [bacterium]|nr:hypothetical protein [bacterium]